MVEKFNQIHLPGYEAQLSCDALHHSREKLEMESSSLVSFCLDNKRDIQYEINRIPCQHQHETLSYRCSCTFQIINKNDRELQYAMRHAGEAMPLNSDYFPVATPRIQNVMVSVISILNSGENIRANNCTSSENKYNSENDHLRNNLASISFVSSWGESSDCIVTFNYSSPLGSSNKNDINEQNAFTIITQQAENLRIQSNITTLLLRSKKQSIICGRKSMHITDLLYLNLPVYCDSSFSYDYDAIKVSLQPISNENIESKLHRRSVIVQYKKPSDAFQHPNANTMIIALEWMLRKFHIISDEFRRNYSEENSNNKEMRYVRLLEMYCGCGAHTMAIAKSGILDTIVAVEIDPRLVTACEENCKLNGCSVDIEQQNHSQEGYLNPNVTPVYVFKGDAGMWASKLLKHNEKKISNGDFKFKTSQDYWFDKEFHILLVDPPRIGLDEKVIELAMRFTHIIYISCGKEALRRDLGKLKSHFDVADCTMTDLFPRTDSIETLVHLRRIKK